MDTGDHGDTRAGEADAAQPNDQGSADGGWSVGCRVRLWGGPLAGRSFEAAVVGRWLRFPGDELEQGRYVLRFYEGSTSPEPSVATYVWEPRS